MSDKNTISENNTLAPKKVKVYKAQPQKTLVRRKRPNIITKIQFYGSEYDVDNVKMRILHSRNINSTSDIRSLEIYIKPEDNMAYYVLNSKIRDSIYL